jgi:outer membrane biosynthesis protein TonB
MKPRPRTDYAGLSIPGMVVGILVIILGVSGAGIGAADTERNSQAVAAPLTATDDPLLPILCQLLPLPILGCPSHHPPKPPPEPPPPPPPNPTPPPTNPPPPTPPPPPPPTIPPPAPPAPPESPTTQPTSPVSPQPRQPAPAGQPAATTTTTTLTTTAGPTTTTNRRNPPVINAQPQVPKALNKAVQTGRRWSLTVLIIIIGAGAALAATRRRIRRSSRPNRTTRPPR